VVGSVVPSVLCAHLGTTYCLSEPGVRLRVADPVGVVRKLMGRTAEHERLQAVSFPRLAGVPVTCGSSTDGDRLQGRVERSRANAGFDAEGTITTADGTAPFAARLSSADPFTGRAVFLEDGRSRGRALAGLCPMPEGVPQLVTSASGLRPAGL